ncbi:hypothetical protein SNEBB_011397 [Seison nebaliae]|nr:hypothetical protein SNEBB_011397 [Seison nebaliae]
MFNPKTDLFLNSKYNFIYNKLVEYKNFRYSNKNNFIKFANLHYDYPRTFDEYSKGFAINGNNFFMGNEFLHELSQLWPLTVNILIEYTNKQLGDFMNNDCTFGDKDSGYVAKLGADRGKGALFNKSLKTCFHSSYMPVHGSPFKVNNQYGFWGSCNVPFVTVFFKTYAVYVTINIEFDFEN